MAFLLLAKSNTEKLEKYFLGYSSLYFKILSLVMKIFKVGSTTLHLARLRTLATETFKVAYGLSPTYLQEFSCFKQT